MDIHQTCRLRLSFKNATIAVTVLNVILALVLLQGFLSSTTYRNKRSPSHCQSLQLRYIKECEEIRLAMLPLELIKRVKEIDREAYIEPETVEWKDAKQTAAVDLSKRLNDLRSLNDATNFKALEEWRKRKMERARQRELVKNGTGTFQA